MTYTGSESQLSLEIEEMVVDRHYHEDDKPTPQGHLGDYVSFEHIGADREWHQEIGKVLGFPSEHYVKVGWYGAEHDTFPSRMDHDELYAIAEREDKMDLFHEHEQLSHQLAQESAEEQAASNRLFEDRDRTLNQQTQSAAKVEETMLSLDQARGQVEAIPARQWRDVRIGGRPSDEMINLFRAVMVILREDKIVSWDGIQAFLRQPDFMDRMLTADCAVFPLKKNRTEKILDLCTDRRSKKHRASLLAGQAIDPTGYEVGTCAALDASIREWVNAQIACSEAGKLQERTVDECFIEQQKQRALLRDVNERRIHISTTREKLQEVELRICGKEPHKPVADDGHFNVPNVYIKRTIGFDKRFQQEIIPRSCILVYHGAAVDEDVDGCVRLNEEQMAELHAAVESANAAHLIQEVADLDAAEQRVDEEIQEINDRLEELRHKEHLTAEEEEEQRQLEKLLQNAKRRRQIIRERRAELFRTNRIESKESALLRDMVETRLYARFTGTEWDRVLSHPQNRKAVEEAYRKDVCAAVGLPAVNVSDVRFQSGYTQRIDCAARHGRDISSEELQALLNESNFANVLAVYYGATRCTAYPVNTAEQEKAYIAFVMLTAEEERQRCNFGGAGRAEKLEDFEGHSDDVDPGISSDEDYRKPDVVIVPARVDYDISVCCGPVIREVERSEGSVRRPHTPRQGSYRNVPESHPTHTHDVRDAEEEEEMQHMYEDYHHAHKSSGSSSHVAHPEEPSYDEGEAAHEGQDLEDVIADGEDYHHHHHDEEDHHHDEEDHHHHHHHDEEAQEKDVVDEILNEAKERESEAEENHEVDVPAHQRYKIKDSDSDSD